jgi:hypothetical protein
MKLLFSVFVFVVACGFATTVNAQEEVQNAQEVQEFNQLHPDLNLNEDKTLLIDADTKTPRTQVNHDSTPSAANAKGRNDNQPNQPKSPAEKTEEDPLSFNFLYFIIQKFKISDIVD